MLRILTQDGTSILTLHDGSQISAEPITSRPISEPCAWAVASPSPETKSVFNILGFYRTKERAAKEIKSIFEVLRRNEQFYEITKDEEEVITNGTVYGN